MKILKEISKYLLIFLGMLILLVSLLVVSSNIRKKDILPNIKESAEILSKRPGIERVQNKRDYTYLHTYADSMILNIIYCLDTENAFESVLEAKYYETIKIDANTDFVEVVKNDFEGNTEYVRYWHGSMVIIRPLLLFFNIEQIYNFLTIILMLLIFIVLGLLYKKSEALSLIVLIGMLMINIFITGFCFEYVWTMLLMLIFSILAIFVEKKGNKKLYRLFFISGMLTCYFDFLTTELVTVLLPVLLVILVRYREKRLVCFKDGFLFLIKSGFLWFIGYAGMWMVKWLLASVVLNASIEDWVKSQAFIRINGDIPYTTNLEMYIGAIVKNIYALFPINIVKRVKKFILPSILFILVYVYFLDKKKIREKWIVLLLLLIAMIPYVRYLFLANHSYKHYFFTFRTQIVTVIALIYAIGYSLDVEKIKGIIKNN